MNKRVVWISFAVVALFGLLYAFFLHTVWKIPLFIGFLLAYGFYLYASRKVQAAKAQKPQSLLREALSLLAKGALTVIVIFLGLGLVAGLFA